MEKERSGREGRGRGGERSDRQREETFLTSSFSWRPHFSHRATEDEVERSAFNWERVRDENKQEGREMKRRQRKYEKNDGGIMENEEETRQKEEGKVATPEAAGGMYKSAERARESVAGRGSLRST